MKEKFLDYLNFIFIGFLIVAGLKIGTLLLKPNVNMLVVCIQEAGAPMVCSELKALNDVLDNPDELLNMERKK